MTADRLAKVRATITKALPGAERVTSYGMPAWKLHGRIAIYLGAWKHHFSIYPATVAMTKAFREELAPYPQSGKGTIQFPYDKPPLRLIAKLARFRANELATPSPRARRPRSPAPAAKLRRP